MPALADSVGGRLACVVLVISCAGDEYTYDPADPVRERTPHLCSVLTSRLDTVADVVVYGTFDQAPVAKSAVGWHLYSK